MTSIPSIRSLTLNLPPSCIAFCPSKPRYFVVGTYFLHPNEAENASENIEGSQYEDTGPANEQTHRQRRSGSLILFRLEGDTIEHVVTKETDFAILDARWAPYSHELGDLLAVATSTGLLVFYRLDTTCHRRDLVHLFSKPVADSSLLVLSLCWHPKYAYVIGFTLSDGSVRVCETAQEEPWVETADVRLIDVCRHDLEAWTLSFSGPDLCNVLSGGDDIVLQNSSLDGLGEVTVQWQDRRLHQAGITAILPLTSDLAITGSYDDHIRLVSFSANARRQVLAEQDLGGGVWQLKTLSACCIPLWECGELKTNTSLPISLVILASCMHAGTRLIQLCKGEDGVWTFEVVASFSEHKSMNYGGDVQPSHESVKSIVSTSFYDKLLCLWRFDVDSI